MHPLRQREALNGRSAFEGENRKVRVPQLAAGSSDQRQATRLPSREIEGYSQRPSLRRTGSAPLSGAFHAVAHFAFFAVV